ncbi:hypothetical protein Ahia01_000661900 [Argonauta hians]
MEGTRESKTEEVPEDAYRAGEEMSYSGEPTMRSSSENEHEITTVTESMQSLSNDPKDIEKTQAATTDPSSDNSMKRTRSSKTKRAPVIFTIAEEPIMITRSENDPEVTSLTESLQPHSDDPKDTEQTPTEQTTTDPSSDHPLKRTRSSKTKKVPVTTSTAEKGMPCCSESVIRTRSVVTTVTESLPTCSKDPKDTTKNKKKKACEHDETEDEKAEEYEEEVQWVFDGDEDDEYDGEEEDDDDYDEENPSPSATSSPRPIPRPPTPIVPPSSTASSFYFMFTRHF